MAKYQKQCYFTKRNIDPDYKDPSTLTRYLTQWGKLKSGRDTGTCSKHQRQLTKAVKRARFLALISYTSR